MLSKGRNGNNSKENERLRYFLKLQIITAVNYTVLLILAGIISVAGDISEKYMYAVSLAVFASGSFVSGYISGMKRRRNGMISGIISALPINIIFIILSVIMNGMTCDFRLLITLGVIIIASATGGIISVNTKVRK